MSEGQLVKRDDLPVSRYASDAEFIKISGAGPFPRIQLMGSNSDIVKKGEFPMGHYALVVGRNYNDIGSEVTAIVLGWRPKAMDFDENIECFNPSASDFQAIKNKAETVKGPGCGFGPEFLFWLPDHKILTTYFCGNVTARNEAKIIHGFIGKSCLLCVKYIEGKKYSWHGPEVKACEVDVTMPDMVKLKEAFQLFSNPPEKELIEKEDDDRD